MKTLTTNRRSQKVSYSGSGKLLIIMCCTIIFIGSSPKTDKQHSAENVELGSNIQAGQDQMTTVTPGLWIGENVKFYVSSDGKQIKGEDWSFEATVYFPEGNPVGLKSVRVRTLIPIDIDSTGRFQSGGVEGHFTSPSECLGTVEHIHKEFFPTVSVTGTLKWTATHVDSIKNNNSNQK